MTSQVQAVWCSTRRLPYASPSLPPLTANTRGLCSPLSNPSVSFPGIPVSCVVRTERSSPFRKALNCPLISNFRAGKSNESLLSPRLRASAADGVQDGQEPVTNVDRAPLEKASGESGSFPLVAPPSWEETGSVFWLWGPIALLSSLLLPQFFLPSAVEAVLKNEMLAEIVASLFSEGIFYIGLAIFLYVTTRMQQPYLESSQKHWNLVMDHSSYLYSSYLTMGIKVFAPILSAYLVWQVIGLPAIVAVAPFLLGLAAQYAFEEFLRIQKSSCWPLVTIIFEVYRLYQLNRGAHFVERSLASMNGSEMTREILERSSALVSMLVVFQVLGVVCLWSLTVFLLRLLPSRRLTENQ